MTKKYDVVIVGAGPSGLLAAKAAGQAGVSVALLERKADIARLERMCGQTLVSMNDYYFDDLVSYNREGRRIGFLNSGFSFSYTGPVKNCYAWHIFSPDGGSLRFGLPEQTRPQGDQGAVGMAYDKEILFKCLLQEVGEAGVDVFPGIDVLEVNSTDDCVTVKSRDRTFEGRYVIAADGTNSRIARLMGFNEDRRLYSYLLSKGWYMRHVAAPATDILISSIAFQKPAPGYMFIFPRPCAEDLNVVFLTLDPRVNLDEVAEHFTRKSPFFAPWFRQAERMNHYASAQYIFSPVKDPYRRRVLLAGDTGSCQELENSGAMISGWRAGSAVAAAVREERVGLDVRAISDYVAWWQRTYIEKCPHEDYLMNFALPYVLDTQEDFNYLCSLVDKPLPPCWNPYAAVGHLGRLMQGLIPRIQQDRPEMMAKLAKMAAPMAELLAETTRACRPDGEME